MLARAAVMDPPRIRMRRGTALAAKPVAEQNGFRWPPKRAFERRLGRRAKQALLWRSSPPDPAQSRREGNCPDVWLC
jgi:hypothetical protein